MRPRRWRFMPTSHYQQVKHRAALRMTVIGAVLLVCTLISVFFVDLGIILFLSGSSLGFFLVGFQQQVDALAASSDDSPKEEPNGEQDT